MRLIIQPDYQKVSKWTADYVAKRIIDARPTAEKPFVLGLPTGSSPLGMYKELINLNKHGIVSFKNVVTFNMDEYVGLPKEHPESYHSFMWNNFFSHIDIERGNVNILDGNASDFELECRQYEEKIAGYGGIDLFLGGIGARRPYRFQRAGLEPRLAHPYENPDHRHHHCQLALFQQRHLARAAQGPDRRRRHRARRPRSADYRQRTRQSPRTAPRRGRGSIAHAPSRRCNCTGTA